MTLQSTAQTKKFIAEGASINKRATVGAFYIQRKSSSKSFADTHDFSTRQANSQSFRGTHTAFDTSSQQPIGGSQPAYSTQVARGVRDAPQAIRGKVKRHLTAKMLRLRLSRCASC
ncbi:MAG: hypothetical protein DMC62_07695 [Verrucomicrobia bacterium]|nr:MAG: hypothetical protein DMC62_07695 [Verrucomicrobiota bacterium]